MGAQNDGKGGRGGAGRKLKMWTRAWDGRYRMECVAVTRQRPVDESGITDCVSSFV